MAPKGAGCDLYPNINKGLCKPVDIPVTPVPPPQIRLLHVVIKLQWMDPEGKTHVFPRDTPATAIMPSGKSIPVKVGADGALVFDFDRNEKEFSLNFDFFGDLSWVVTLPASAKSPEPEELHDEAGAKSAAANGAFAWKLPQQFSTRTAKWDGSTIEVFKNGGFTDLNVDGNHVGDPSAPAPLTLLPLWQYLKFTYFDRSRGAVAFVPPVFVSGDLHTLATNDPTAFSNWQTAKGSLALPWVGKDIDFSGIVDLRFKTDTDTFVETRTDGSRALSVGSQMLPSPDRLRFYDLPQRWRSALWHCTIGGKSDRFEKLAATPTSDGDPLTFSLDDMVLTDDTLVPLPWVPQDRVALFDNTFRNGPLLMDIGPWNPDPNNKWVSKLPSVETDRNYIFEHPPFTRALIANGNLHFVFNDRTPDFPGRVVGARAARRRLNSTFYAAPGFMRPGGVTGSGNHLERVDIFYSVPNRRGNSPGSPVAPPATPTSGADHDEVTGRADVAIFRCCGNEKGIERAVVLQYLRATCSFAKWGTTTPPVPSAAQQTQYMQNLADGVTQRWNAKDKFSDALIEIVPRDQKTNPVAFWTYLWVEPIPQANRAIAHIEFSVIFGARAGFGSITGTGTLKEDEDHADPSGAYAGAHECGHGRSLWDEYVEVTSGCSYFGPALFSSSPGAPFRFDEPAMMNQDSYVRARYGWHFAELLHREYGFDTRVQHASTSYQVIHRPAGSAIPSDANLAHWPFDQAFNASLGGATRYDWFLYTLGPDQWATTAFPGHILDGELVFVVKLDIRSPDDDDIDLLRDGVSRIESEIADRLNRKWAVSGTRASSTGNGTLTFQTCMLRFSPRFLGGTTPGDVTHIQAVFAGDTLPAGMTWQQAYQQRVAQIRADHPPHVRAIWRDSGDTTIVAGSPIIFTTEFDAPGDADRFADGLQKILGLTGDADQANDFSNLMKSVFGANFKVFRIA